EERIKDTGREMAAEASEEARSALERGKTNAVEAAERTSEALDETAANLASEGQETLAEVASMLSGKLSGLARSLESRSLDELATDARELARSNPGMFVAGGVALGVALSRFFKASGEYQGAGLGASGGGRSAEGSMQPYGTEAAVPPEVRAAAQRSGSASTAGGTQGNSGARETQGRTS
ncbi:MAG: hypothetical protein ACNA7W_17795, partial [Pseudomonadales bacterium]